MSAAIAFDKSDISPLLKLGASQPERKAKLHLVPAQQRATKTASPLSRAAGVGEGWGEGKKAWHSPLLMDFRDSAVHYPSFDRHCRFSGLRRPPRDRRRDSASDGPTCVSKWTRAEPDAARMCFGYIGGLGYYHDQDLSMPLLSIRHYQPRTGLFIARDPVLTEPRYQYVGGVPTGRVDAEGSKTRCVFWYNEYGAGILGWSYIRLNLEGWCYVPDCCTDYICDFRAELKLTDSSGAGIAGGAGVGECGADASVTCVSYPGPAGLTTNATPVSPFVVGRQFAWSDSCKTVLGPGPVGAGIHHGTLHYHVSGSGGYFGADVACVYGGVCGEVLTWGMSGTMEVVSSGWVCNPTNASWIGPYQPPVPPGYPEYDLTYDLPSDEWIL